MAVSIGLTFAHNLDAQTANCDDVVEFVMEEGYLQSSMSNYTLNSSWLYKVTAYHYANKIYVIAEIKKNEYSFQTSTYIFCGIPATNWRNLQFGAYGDSQSYGE